MNRIETFLIALFLDFTSILANIQIAQSNEAPDLHRRSKLDTLKAVLQSDGFQITPGGMFQPNVLKLACDGILASCNGNYNTNPYLVTSVPSAGSHYNPADPTLKFMIRQDEAIVLIGRTPAPVNYILASGASFLIATSNENRCDVNYSTVFATRIRYG
ncbi:MAG: hypothetical protein WA151_06160 [Desulfatirhabdiaceae bacterium]